MSSGKNPFYNPEEIDDDAFLKHPKSGNSGYLLPQYEEPRPASGFGGAGGSVGGGRGSTLDQQQRLMQKRREIEERTVESSHRSLGLLYESEKVGQATAEELSRQKEQLKATESRLDDINSTLKQSERHLNGIKSIFGGIRNYFNGRGAAPAQGSAAPTMSASGGSRISSSQSDQAMALPDGGRLDSMRNASHPGLQIRGLDEGSTRSGNQVDDILDRNLEEMSKGLSRLKGLAVNLNEELDEHNDIIDRLDHKSSTTQWRVEKQNKDMNKLLKK